MSERYGSGLHEYADRNSLDEHFDIDLRDPAVDGQHCLAGGNIILGNWQASRGDMQFRGTIHHVELHSSTLSDSDVEQNLHSLYSKYAL